MPSRGGATARAYLLWQVPGWALTALVLAWLAVEVHLPVWLAALVFAAFVAKDIALYPVMRATFDRRPWSARPIGTHGVVVEPLHPTGLVRVNGELWRAEGTRSIDSGARVVVRDMRGLTLLVDALDAAPQARPEDRNPASPP